MTSCAERSIQRSARVAGPVRAQRFPADRAAQDLGIHLRPIPIALHNIRTARDYFADLADGNVVGYYTLVVGEVAFESAHERLTKGLARHPVPIMLLARLAVATSWQGKGLGAGLLKDALQRTLQAADIAGIRAFTVHAKDDGARAFYGHFGFSPLPSDPYHLFRLLKDIRADRKS